MLRYTRVAIGLHWLIALVLLSNIGLGVWMVDAIRQDASQSIAVQGYQLHKSLGFCVLWLSLLRLLWRLLHKPPALPADTPAWQARAAGLTHAGLYMLMLAIPLSGWLYVSTQWGRNGPLSVPTWWFGLFEIPHIGGLNQLPDAARELWSQRLHEAHEYLAWAIVLLALGHIGAAIKHQFVDQDGVMSRMLPRRPFLWLVAALMLLAATLVIGLSPKQAAQSGAASISSSGWQIDPDASAIEFSGTHSGKAFSGHFKRWHVDLKLDPRQAEKSRIVTTIDTASARTGIKLNDETLREAEWFDVAQFPQARFVAESVHATDNGDYLIDGTLTIKGRSTAVAPLRLQITETQAMIEAQLSIERADFDLGMESDPDGEWVSRTINITVKLVATPDSR